MRYFKKRKDTTIDTRNYVEVYIWPQTDRNSAGHVSLKIMHDGREHHVSYWHQRDITQCEKDKLKTQYTGIDPYWVDTFKNDCLIEGFRHYSAENPKLNARDILQKIEETQFRKSMQPTHTIKLFTLDTGKMLNAFSEYKNNVHKWAFFSGFQHHSEGAHNCSSIALFLLHQGGMGSCLSNSYAESLRNIGLIMSMISSPLWATAMIPFCATTVLSGLAGSLIGGAVDGYRDVQPFLRVIEINEKDSIAAKCGITASAMLMSSIAAVIQKTHYCISRFTLPGNVLELAMQAAMSEASAISRVERSVMLPLAAM